MQIVYIERKKGKVIEAHIESGFITWKYKKLNGGHDLTLINVPPSVEYHKYSDELLEARDLLNTIKQYKDYNY